MCFKEKSPNNQIESFVKQLHKESNLLDSSQPDYLQLNKYIEIYENQGGFNNRVVFLYDHKRKKIVFSSENVTKISGYTPAEIKFFGIGLYFKLLHPDHYSIVFRQAVMKEKLLRLFARNAHLDRKIHIGGLKWMTKDKKTKRAFLSIKPIIVNEENQLEMSIIYGEDYTYLFKGQGYWVRVAKNDLSHCFVNNDEKKEFEDLVNPTELEIVKLAGQQYTSKEIAQKLNMSISKINYHRKNMIACSSAKNITALVHLCKRAELY